MQTWTFDPTERRLEGKDGFVPLTAKAAAVLECLIAGRGGVVSRRDILRQVWGRLHVTPDLVREYVFDLRQALGDDAADPRYIETVRGKGYRLIGPVSTGRPRDCGAYSQRPRLAVLRPELAGGDETWRQLADALGQEVTVDLARYPDLALLNRHTSYAHEADGDLRALGRALQADFLILITLAPRRGKLDLRVDLIDGKDGTMMSCMQEVLDAADLPALTGTVATRISVDLGRFRGGVQDAVLEKVRRKPARLRNAYEEYLLAVECEHVHSRESWRQGLRHANAAIDLDPNFARAWHMRCTFLRGLVSFFCDPELVEDTAFREAMVARQKSLILDPRDPQILAWSAEMHMANGDASRAQDALVRAADLGRNQPDTLAYCSLAFARLLGAFSDAIDLIDEAMMLSPERPDWYRFVECRVAFFAGDHERCVSVARDTLHGLPSLLFGSLSLAVLGRQSEAESLCHRMQRGFPEFHPEDYLRTLIVHPEARQRFRDALTLLQVSSPIYEDVPRISPVRR